MNMNSKAYYVSKWKLKINNSISVVPKIIYNAMWVISDF